MPKSRLGNRSPLKAALGRTAPKKPKAARTSFMVAREVAERVRDAAYWERQTVVEFVERALLAEVERLEETRGETFPPRNSDRG